MSDEKGNRRRRYGVEEVCRETGVDSEFVFRCLKEQWITPADREANEFDREDLARLDLIRDLREVMGVNDEGVSVVLRLLDEIHFLRRWARRTSRR